MSILEDRPVSEIERDALTAPPVAKELEIFTEVSLQQQKPIRREQKFGWMALVLVVAVVLGMFLRAVGATSQISYNDIVRFTGVTCEITDRFEKSIYKDGKVESYAVFGNLIGYQDRIENSLLYRHAASLCPEGANPLLGYKALESEPRVMQTTLLPTSLQQQIASMFGNKSGCCYAFNYETGEIYMALSLPAYDPTEENTTYINRCFSSTFTPGSTMKIITTALAADQGKNIEKMKFTCNQTYTLQDGNEIVCVGNHGKIDISTAIGKSCNCYFAQFIESLNLDKAVETLKGFGFKVNGSSQPSELVDGLYKTVSSTTVVTTSAFADVWGLIGQGTTQVSPIDMARLAAAVVNGGEVAQPRLVKSIVNPNENNEVIYASETETVRLLSEKTAKKTAAAWKKGVDANYYTYQGMSSRISYAKTGTAQHDNRLDDKLLVGVVESSKTAFFIVVENASGGVTPMKIANKLVQLLPSN